MITIDQNTAKHEHIIRVISDFLDLLEAMNIEKWINLWAEEGVHNMPYAPAGFPNRLEGKETIFRHFSTLPKAMKRMAFIDRKIYPTLNPNLAIAEYYGETEIADTGRSYNNHYCGLFELRDGRLISVKEYFNPLVFKESFGDNTPQA
ncbi:nuclear transport factor 2 family protein (plasmid) [Nostoc edaphicum CCNP1411]|uniref:Nuclear transport factor 2 family protein n=1 Tax=Nostoc edaphicum CCNP1411 TaxID=1472755 RepID=A0A7D7L926_9NOSO|nr:nuclear transport factor 2 family protein [Nostoc edaphicum]QMS86248.1 nuclear transport factor 2 family protein [Nostoc edaphicum CCNP1411]